MTENVVILGVTKATEVIFNQHFPILTKLVIEPYHIRYSGTLPLSVKLLMDAPRILNVIKRERRQLQQIVKDYKIDVVISDNRFGLYSKHAECIYITHQLNIQAGLFSGIANKIHQHYMKQFDAVWVPDFEDNNQSLAGKLSRNLAFKNVKYLGSLSRLPILEDTAAEFDYLCLLSGPEPLRTELENILISKANVSDQKICIVRGTKAILNVSPLKKVTIIDMPDASQLSHLIIGSKKVVCRSGYSTLMDLHHLQKTNCILIPTPGQDEQIYLAGYWQQKFGSKVCLQKNLNHFLFD
jgi:UDP-N-acetylglucosamine:LPS N-acetylglucosamine transferase